MWEMGNEKFTFLSQKICYSFMAIFSKFSLPTISRMVFWASGDRKWSEKRSQVNARRLWCLGYLKTWRGDKPALRLTGCGQGRNLDVECKIHFVWSNCHKSLCPDVLRSLGGLSFWAMGDFRNLGLKALAWEPWLGSLGLGAEISCFLVR